MNRMLASFKLAFLLSFVFFLAAYLTLKDYGISWDETIHWRRGQAYLHFFLTGETDFRSLPQVNLQGTGGKPENIPQPRRSFYQNDYHTAEYWKTHDVGHPPLSDELAALANFIFFQKLGLLDDISAFHLYNILTGSAVVFFGVYFASSTFGRFAGLVTFLALATYPLFWAESHFNMKDVAQAAYFSAFLFSVHKSLRPSKIWLLLSALFFGLALGTKFNILFTPFVVIPYLLIRLRGKSFKLSKGYLATLLSWPFVVLLIFVETWPFLWRSPDNILKIFNFYRNIGMGTQYQPDSFIFLGFNTFPLQWILFTTPPVVLVLLGIGLFSCWKNRYKYHSVTILWLLWLLVPIVRVSLPGFSIYGGVRQIFEFIPALALISGLGAWQITKWLNSPIVKLLIVFAFLWPMQTLISLHPNENVYFNSLIGGLKGAKDRNFPSWGNSFGNAYFQGINWLNKNAEIGAKLVLVQGTPANAPAILLRRDINYLYSDTSDKTYFSGDVKEGEYLIELTYNDTHKPDSEIWRYVEENLAPVYEVKVDGVPILKIWKNDLGHTKTGL